MNPPEGVPADLRRRRQRRDSGVDRHQLQVLQANQRRPAVREVPAGLAVREVQPEEVGVVQPGWGDDRTADRQDHQGNGRIAGRGERRHEERYQRQSPDGTPSMVTSMRVRLRPVMWETDATLGLEGRPQEMINKKLVSQSPFSESSFSRLSDWQSNRKGISGDGRRDQGVQDRRASPSCCTS